MSAPGFDGIDIGAGQAGLGLIVIFCIAAIWAAAGRHHNERDNKPDTATGPNTTTRKEG
jgi:hypothetical protein